MARYPLLWIGAVTVAAWAFLAPGRPEPSLEVDPGMGGRPLDLSRLRSLWRESGGFDGPGTVDAAWELDLGGTAPGCLVEARSEEGAFPGGGADAASIAARIARRGARVSLARHAGVEVVRLEGEALGPSGNAAWFASVLPGPEPRILVLTAPVACASAARARLDAILNGGRAVELPNFDAAAWGWLRCFLALGCFAAGGIRVS